MVTECPKCDQFAYASRYKDSYVSFCRACGYWQDVDEDGYYDSEKLVEMRSSYPLSGDSVAERFK